MDCPEDSIVNITIMFVHILLDLVGFDYIMLDSINRAGIEKSRARCVRWQEATPQFEDWDVALRIEGLADWRTEGFTRAKRDRWGSKKQHLNLRIGWVEEQVAIWAAPVQSIHSKEGQEAGVGVGMGEQKGNSDISTRFVLLLLPNEPDYALFTNTITKARCQRNPDWRIKSIVISFPDNWQQLKIWSLFQFIYQQKSLLYLYEDFSILRRVDLYLNWFRISFQSSTNWRRWNQ